MDLIKTEKGYYVPKEYRFEDGEAVGYPTDMNLKLPKIVWDTTTKKFKLTLVGADIGGYDCEYFTLYFDNLTDIYKTFSE